MQKPIRYLLDEAHQRGYLETTSAALADTWRLECAAYGRPCVTVLAGQFAAWGRDSVVEWTFVTCPDDALTPAGYAQAALATRFANEITPDTVRAVVFPPDASPRPDAYWRVSHLPLGTARLLAKVYATASLKRLPIATLLESGDFPLLDPPRE